MDMATRLMDGATHITDGVILIMDGIILTTEVTTGVTIPDTIMVLTGTVTGTGIMPVAGDITTTLMIMDLLITVQGPTGAVRLMAPVGCRKSREMAAETVAESLAGTVKWHVPPGRQTITWHLMPLPQLQVEA